ncbi:MAG: hypothetical protein LBR16_02030 [Treponema sp.]|jgi:dienelactone hydrolase|nr:hypothetical protein [Treponema sp.]
MREICISEVIAGLFLLLALLRPLVLRLRHLDGLIWLPALALLIMAAIVPAYGFRPEALPLGIFAAVATLVSIPAMKDSASGLRRFSEGKRRLLAAPACLILGACVWLALVFSPPEEALERVPPDLAQTVLQPPPPGQNGLTKELYVRFYAAPKEDAPPLLLLIPPAFGGAEDIEPLCRALARRGFGVLTWACKGVDSPAVDSRGVRSGISLGEKFRRLRLALRSRSASLDAHYDALVEERASELRFLLSRLVETRSFLSNVRASRDAIFLAGCAEGGAALFNLAGEKTFVQNYAEVKGIIAIESPPRPRGQAERAYPAEAAPEAAAWYLRAWITVKNVFTGTKKTEIPVKPEPAPPGCPCLALVSDRAAAPEPLNAPYAGLFTLLSASSKPALLAAAEGAGAFDYTGITMLYPLYQAIFPGWGTAGSASRYVETAAALAADFASVQLDGLMEWDPASRVPPPRRGGIEGNVHIERWSGE